MAQKTDRPIWEYYAAHPAMAKRFAGAMATFADAPAISPTLLAKNYPWASLGGGSGLVVDVGGSKGNISAVIAQSAPELRFVVQDLPGAMLDAKKTLPQDVAERIEFRDHDFFHDQPVKADAFLFRMIFHNWPDDYVVKILRATIPGLKHGGKIIINDYLIPEPNTMSLMEERTIRYVVADHCAANIAELAREMDMIMLTLFNSRDRERHEWVRLFGQTDPRFRDVKAWVPDGSSLAIIEATWSE